jgi:hypothetical protein
MDKSMISATILGFQSFMVLADLSHSIELMEEGVGSIMLPYNVATSIHYLTYFEPLLAELMAIYQDKYTMKKSTAQNFTDTM